MSYTTFSKSQWVRDQMDEAISPRRDFVDDVNDRRANGWPAGAVTNYMKGNSQYAGFTPMFHDMLCHDIWTGACPLRNMVAFAIQQFVIVSSRDRAASNERILAYWEILRKNAFTTIEQLMQEISLTAAMANYLTFFAKKKADPATGTSPDENYARELMQLFSIGVIDLERNGTPKLTGGQETETYSSVDIQQLARVFTGFINPQTNNADFQRIPDRDVDENANRIDFRLPLNGVPADHEWGAKTFLGSTIPEVTDPAEQTVARMQQEVRDAVSIICQHDNLLPFWAIGLIKTLVKSNPTPAYVEYVVSAGEVGLFQLPDGTVIGSGVRSDLKAMICAVMFHNEAHVVDFADPNAGKIRHPYVVQQMIRRWCGDYEGAHPPTTTSIHGSHFYRGFGSESDADLLFLPCYQPSVFGHGSPFYVPVGTPAGDAGLTSDGLEFFLASTFADFLRSQVPGVGNGGFGGDINGAELLMDLAIAANADFDADVNAYCDKIANQYFGGLLSAQTVAIMKEISGNMYEAFIAGTPATRTNFDTRSLTPIAIGILSTEHWVQR